MSSQPSPILPKNNQPPSGDQPPVAKRRRGGQSGNTNALKHGFYSTHFRRSDTKDLDKCEFAGLKDEIYMLRVYIRRCIEMSGQVATLTESIQLLRALSLATASINRLIKTQFYIIPDTDPLQGALHKALDELWAEWDRDGYGNTPVPAVKKDSLNTVQQRHPTAITADGPLAEQGDQSLAAQADCPPAIQDDPPLVMQYNLDPFPEWNTGG